MTDYFSEYDILLDNLLGINDPNELKHVEEDIVSIRLVELAQQPIDGNFDFDHLLAIHKFLFGDIYSFAGKVRDVDIAKSGSTFCYVQNIQQMQAEIFGRLKSEDYLVGLDRAVFINKLAELAGNLNALHPFREGNGRTIRAFLAQLATKSNYVIAYEETKKDQILEADISAFAGDMQPLIDLFSSIIRKY